MGTIHVSITAETLAQLGSFSITNALFTSLIISFLILLITFFFATTKKNLKPSGFQNLVEMIIEGLYKLTITVAGQQKARFFFPLIATLFIFILFNNWVSVLPGVGTIGINREVSSAQHSSSNFPQIMAAEESLDQAQITTDSQHADEPNASDHSESDQESSEEKHSSFSPLFRAATADLNTTLALALISVFLTQYYGIKYLGLGYFKKFINFSNPINTFVGVLEIISEFAKIISFSFRLFGNIFAGEVLLAVTGFLVPFLAPIPFLGLEVFVGLIQALVFAMLTLVFINMATISHDQN